MLDNQRHSPGNSIFLEIFWTRVRSIANEAAKLIIRTSFSTLSSEANDFAVVITDSSGNAIAENAGSIPSFIGTLPRTVKTTLASIGADAMRDGDVYITNNPWHGTGHLNDVCLVKPIFHGGRIVAFAATAGHVPDIGGKIRSVDSRELFEEGFHIPLMRFLSAGVPDESLILLLRTNVRTPDQTVGDLWSHVGALDLIAGRLAAVLREYALDGVDALAAALFERSEVAMREAIRTIPDGEYRYETVTDGFDSRFRFAVRVQVDNGTITCDFTGSSPQQPRGINCVLAYTNAMSAYAVKCLLLPDMPNNEGLFRAITVVAEPGSILNPTEPAPVSGRACTGHYVPGVIFGALQHVLPHRVMAAAGSPLWIVSVNGLRDDGKPFATSLFFNGGMGATSTKDGASVVSWPSNISPTPLELAERDSPLFFKYKRLRPNSGGPGAHRGGLGEEICFVSRHPKDLGIVFLTERIHEPASGLHGGGTGACGEVAINGAAVDSRQRHTLRPGDEVILRTPGGGGYGAPADRSAAAHRRDLQLGYVV